MNQWLPRGYDGIEDKKIRKIIASDNEWQIYITNRDTYVLVVKNELHERWRRNNDIPDGLFTRIVDHEDIYAFASKAGYLISSLKKGPYPSEAQQIEAFAIAFNTARKLEYNLEDSIYIEEYSMLLPVKEGEGDNALAFGKWITGGVGVSVESFAEVQKIMSWITTDELKKSIGKAGFDYAAKTIKVAEEVAVIYEANPVNRKYNIPEEDFKLTGRADLEKFINDNIIDVLRNYEAYERMEIGFPGATIMHGPPGCGKTFAVDRLTDYLGWRRYDINSATIGSPYIHETGRKISEVFDRAMSEAPSIVVIDEMEAYLSNRKNKEGHHVEEVAEFLRKIPEAISNNVLVFGMTNMIDKIDPAILRRGRFDYIVEIDMASKDEIKELLIERFETLPVDKDVDVDVIAERLQRRPLSDVTFVLREAGRLAVRKKQQIIDYKSFEEALSLLPKEPNGKGRKIGF